ncbi:hypothetical protein LMG23992_02469 [Cupriavidus laharis]|uniref:DUF302 domain-containing protein n=2 Tax=Cupriavidus laharis TaxID=151654 RepID=A0ABM8X0V5_9BURK|nr:hypothetical protein LMG23992_02469 [Cupriavidus laharis]
MRLVESPVRTSCRGDVSPPVNIVLRGADIVGHLFISKKLKMDITTDKKKILYKSSKMPHKKWAVVLQWPIISATLALVGSLLGSVLGQLVNASTEADKVIRVKLEDAYHSAVSLPEFATDFHMAAFGPMTPQNFSLAANRYDAARLRFSERVSKIVEVRDLYEPRISEAAGNVVTCAHEFGRIVGDLFLIEAEQYGQLVIHPKSYSNPALPLTRAEVIGVAVKKRLDCERFDENLKRAISSAMKHHL